MQNPGIEPGLSGPQHDVLTTILILQFNNFGNLRVWESNPGHLRDRQTYFHYTNTKCPHSRFVLFKTFKTFKTITVECSSN